MAFDIYPSIDLRGGRVVRLRQGDFARETDYDVDPAVTAGEFERAGAKWVHLVDLDGAREGRVRQTELIAKMLASVSVRGQVGGGVRTEADIKALLGAGAARVVIGTAALEDWEWFRGLAHRSEFAGKLVLALDARDGVVATRGWTVSSGKKATALAAEVTDWPLAALLYTDVAVDGMLSGPNVVRTAELARATKIPVIASGGVGTIEHVAECATSGAVGVVGVVIGRAIYEGKVELGEALRIAAKA
jgi:phosphoribosylformimino-5-aminoimidazole carboxamide ribotide isomerase